jgi:hypothetical protein
MLRPKKEEQRSSANFYSKFARIFGLIMTLVYVALGLFVIFAADTMRLSIGDEIRYMLGGILILYGIVRFVRLYKSSTRNRNDSYED